MSSGDVEKAKTAVVLIAHGTVDALDDLPEFLANIRHGHPAPPELVAEVRRRYEAIGGRSPLNDLNHEVAKKLEARVGLPTRLANRLIHPYPKDVVARLASEGVRRILSVPLAQHSAGVYRSAMMAAVKEVDPSLELVCAPNWGRTPELTDAFAHAILETLKRVPSAEADRTALVLTAHSLPLSVVKNGDPYETEMRASAEAVVARVRELGGSLSADRVAFQSQGLGTAMPWLGPDLRTTLEELAAQGKRHIVVAPIGFLADHVEILYDLDIEAKAWSEELGTVLYRSTSLNAGGGLIDALVAVTRDLSKPADSEPKRGG